MRMFLRFLLVLLFFFLAGCFPQSFDYFKATPTEGYAVGGICRGGSGPPVSVRVERGPVVIIIQQADVTGSSLFASGGPSLVIAVDVANGHVASVDWAQLRFADAATGVSELKPPLSLQGSKIFFTASPHDEYFDVPLDQPLDGNAGQYGDRKLTEFSMQLPLAGDLKPFYLQFPAMVIDGKSYPAFRVDYVWTHGWALMVLNC